VVLPFFLFPYLSYFKLPLAHYLCLFAKSPAFRSSSTLIKIRRPFLLPTVSRKMDDKTPFGVGGGGRLFPWFPLPSGFPLRVDFIFTGSPGRWEGQRVVIASYISSFDGGWSRKRQGVVIIRRGARVRKRISPRQKRILKRVAVCAERSLQRQVRR